MNDCAINDREMIMQAVLDGVLSADYVTEQEIEELLFELEDEVFEMQCDKYTPFAIWETVQ